MPKKRLRAELGCIIKTDRQAVYNPDETQALTTRLYYFEVVEREVPRGFI